MTVALTERPTSDWAATKAPEVRFPTYCEEWPDFAQRPLREKQSRPHPWVDFKLLLLEMSNRSTEITYPEATEAFVPRTPLGRKLLALRTRAMEAGMRLLSADEVLEEVRRRRGELEDDEADIS